ncbi:transmembrane protein, putative (macronuclear) [Tetrahymena thermophila SB210]|uniref:Transmembrane protein, putative n=1 Tax=Tetrahymena thermophila (strain SB210) TaxID=312017 RepID=W7X592_TETTS|nr:transmembrane protein, putative [Tetrahymena thermophila SB210]EWS74530.1 transmembrane protein, putative [Tetrahymena thermophila SB210]|eukprot:XP_012652904.1 transmembrane protein, putative [Tetrahymena thermophila SB210]
MRFTFVLLVALVLLSTMTTVNATTYVKRPVSLHGIGAYKVQCSMTDPSCACWDCYKYDQYYLIHICL